MKLVTVLNPNNIEWRIIFKRGTFYLQNREHGKNDLWHTQDKGNIKDIFTGFAKQITPESKIY